MNSLKPKRVKEKIHYAALGAYLPSLALAAQTYHKTESILEAMVVGVGFELIALMGTTILSKYFTTYND